MLGKEAYIQRLAQALRTQPDELAFLQRLGPEELRLLWTKVAGQALRQHGTALGRSA